jgi:hypothetical protein
MDILYNENLLIRYRNLKRMETKIPQRSAGVDITRKEEKARA